MPDDQTPLADALALVGDRWSLQIVAALRDGPCRFSALQEAVPGIATNVLAQRLRQLETHALVLARQYQPRPARYVYELTDAARGLDVAVDALAAWGAGRAPEELAPKHAPCGTPLALRWWCPTCEVAVDAPGGGDGSDGEDELHFA